MLITISRSYDAILRVFDKVMVAVACLSLFLIMVLIFLDASLRYALNSPLVFTIDVVTLYLMSASMLSILAYTLRHGSHISIDLFANMMPRRVYQVLVGLSLLAAMVACGLIAYETSGLAVESWEMNEVMTGIYAWPFWISKALVAIGFIGLTARLLHAGLFNLLAGVLGDNSLAVAIMHDPTDPEGEI